MDNLSRYEALVRRLEQVEGTEQTILALRSGGEDAKPALLEGMRHPSYRVRRGCLLVLDHSIIDDATRIVVLHALEDPHRKVRTAALHVLGCEVCKPEGSCGIEGADLDLAYLEHARDDRSRRVRRSAIGAFRRRPVLDEEVTEVMRNVLETDEDDDLRQQAAKVLAYPEIAAMPPSPARHARFVDTVQRFVRA
jgi:HEAT repeat protein